ncbi:Cu-Zn family superoxide dismutase [Geomicrobium halophilum]|uniref:Superoxide dismutase [Cu-Zn] n=1 Tax=Geomicrobium halophilum TaxID=549000 RepID=A0A841PPX9_9BACL|nr:superoxide dismutase family protein [Geomicrobium halophilum]MBB6448361.1 Cu-Zn family superoxide dismutase [Geomicrobium halophilum]
MKKRAFHFIFTGIFALVLAACAPEDNENQQQQEGNGGEVGNETEDLTNMTGANGEEAMNDEADAVAELEDENEQSVGTVTFIENEEDHTIVTADVKNLEPGYHGFHIHEAGACEADAEGGAFDTAGGHYAPEEGDHAEHVGDLPPLFVNENGVAKFSVVVDGFTPDELVSEGTTMIIHEDPDNLGHILERYQSEEQDEPGPDDGSLATGDAGDRIACGVIEGPAA